MTSPSRASTMRRVSVGSAHVDDRGDVGRLYRDGFWARCTDAADHGAVTLIDEPGLLAMLPGDGDERAMALVTDDSASASLTALLARHGPALVRVMPTAPGCARRLTRDPVWSTDRSTAMLHPALGTLTAPPLPEGYSLRCVSREDDAAGPTLRKAVGAALAADATIPGSAQSVLEVLRAFPPSYRFLAATDEAGIVRATAASGRFGRYAAVSFVTTAVEHRRRGLATSVTAQALLAARADGADVACLESSSAGVPIYERLGFAAVSPVGVYVRGA